jgi:uncharacterized protein YjdB
LTNIASKSNNGLVQALAEGRAVKITADNIDGRMFANQVMAQD